MAKKDQVKEKLEEFTKQIVEMYKYCLANNVDTSIVCLANDAARCRVALEAVVVEEVRMEVEV